MHRVFRVAFAATLVGAPSLAARAAPPVPIDPAQRAFACEGAIFRALAKSALATTYGAKNVSQEKVTGAEGESETIETTIFAKRPADKFRLSWSDAAKKKVDSVDIFGSNWIGPGGIHVGSTIAEVEKANGRPFAFSGVGWDYGGMVHDWRGGALGPLKPTTHGGPGNLRHDCRLDVVLDASLDAPPDTNFKWSGEQELQSDSPAIAPGRIAVVKITISYGEEN
jgi:hypothetical protein